MRISLAFVVLAGQFLSCSTPKSYIHAIRFDEPGFSSFLEYSNDTFALRFTFTEYSIGINLKNLTTFGQLFHLSRTELLLDGNPVKLTIISPKNDIPNFTPTGELKLLSGASDSISIFRKDNKRFLITTDNGKARLRKQALNLNNKYAYLTLFFNSQNIETKKKFRFRFISQQLPSK